MFKKILVPIDTAEPGVAEPGVFFAAQLAALTHAAVRMLHVLAPLPLHFEELLPPRIRTDRESAARATLLDMAKKANVPTDLFSHTIRTGAIADEVLSEADFWLADLIIVGSHSPSLRRYLLGSNSEKIVRHAQCSVLVMRPPHHKQGNYWLLPQIGS